MTILLQLLTTCIRPTHPCKSHIFKKRGFVQAILIISQAMHYIKYQSSLSSQPYHMALSLSEVFQPRQALNPAHCQDCCRKRTTYHQALNLYRMFLDLASFETCGMVHSVHGCSALGTQLHDGFALRLFEVFESRQLRKLRNIWFCRKGVRWVRSTSSPYYMLVRR